MLMHAAVSMAPKLEIQLRRHFWWCGRLRTKKGPISKFLWKSTTSDKRLESSSVKPDTSRLWWLSYKQMQQVLEIKWDCLAQVSNKEATFLPYINIFFPIIQHDMQRGADTRVAPVANWKCQLISPLARQLPRQQQTTSKFFLVTFGKK